MEVKARRPEIASPTRIIQSDQLIFTMSAESMRHPGITWEKLTVMMSPEMADQLTRTGVETPWNTEDYSKYQEPCR